MDWNFFGHKWTFQSEINQDLLLYKVCSKNIIFAQTTEAHSARNVKKDRDRKQFWIILQKIKNYSFRIRSEPYFFGTFESASFIRSALKI